ncbi:MAG: hypothetical protein AB7R89_06005 [Dehalococcoidia bacterium]
MDSQQRAEVIGHTTLAIEDLKAALKAAKKSEPDTEVGSSVQRAAERLGEVLHVTGVQVHFSANGRGHNDEEDELERRRETATTGRPLLVEGTVLPGFEGEENDGD